MESNGSNATTENGAKNDTSSSTMNQDEQIMLQKQVLRWNIHLWFHFLMIRKTFDIKFDLLQFIKVLIGIALLDFCMLN